MKKSLLLLLMCIGANAATAWAQDDDVYFVPSEKAQSSSQPKHTQKHAYDTYDPVANDYDFQESNWAEGRGNGNWDVDSYNRRGKNYKGQCDEEKSNAVSCYDQGYADGYEDGKYTQRIVRFYSPRPGIYVSSPYYLDCYDFYFDPWYYGYAGGWAWSGWWGWGSWYGWRPYYSNWHWGWGGWYDPWWGWPSYAWYPHHHWHGSWYPAGSERGPRGGYIAYGGRRGAASYSTNGRGNAFGNRPSQSFGRGMPDGVLTTAITSASEITGLRARLATRTDLPEITVTRDLKVTATRIPTENTAKITVRLTTATTAKAVSNARSANLRAAVALTEVAASAVVAEVDSAAVAGADLAEADVADADKM